MRSAARLLSVAHTGRLFSLCARAPRPRPSSLGPSFPPPPPAAAPLTRSSSNNSNNNNTIFYYRKHKTMLSFSDLPREEQVVIVGAGLAGINMAYHVQNTTSKRCLLLEARHDIGGTWSQHNYPGIRSDSDMYSYGMSWLPWDSDRAIARGDEIMDHMRQACAAQHLTDKIYLRSKLLHAAWDTTTCRWTLTVANSAAGSCSGSGTTTLRAQYIFFSTGFFNYEKPHQPPLPGLDKFQGPVVHPQLWPPHLDYTNKSVVVIGSGSTAVTLLPNLAQKAEHVTMVQRTPGYFLSIPSRPGEAWFLRRLPLPASWRFAVLKWLNIMVAYLFIFLSQSVPGLIRWLLRTLVQRELPAHIPLDPHFDPPYNPWDQRMCLVPDGDFFQALRSGKASVLTGKITDFTADSIVLEGNQLRQADLVITATGFDIQLCGGAQITVDGRPVTLADCFLYRGTFVSDVPNAGVAMGYVLATWTLGTDLCARYMCRMIRETENAGKDGVVVRKPLRLLEDREDISAAEASEAAPMPVTAPAPAPAGAGASSDLDQKKTSPEQKARGVIHRLPLLPLQSNFIKRASGVFPSAGSRGGWRPISFLPVDAWRALYRPLDQEVQFLAAEKGTGDEKEG